MTQRLASRPVRCSPTLLRRAGALTVSLSLIVVAASPVAAKTEDPAKKRKAVAQQRADVASKLNVLKASDAEVAKALDDLAANVAEQTDQLNQARTAADAAAAQAAEARALEAAKQTEVDQLRARLRNVALMSYVHRADAGAGDLFFMTNAATVTDAAIQQAYAQLATGRGADVVDALKAARVDLTSTREQADRFARDATARQTDAASLLAEVKLAAAQQQQVQDDVQSRIDSLLAESQYLSGVDRQLADQLAAQQAALASRLGSPNQTHSYPRPGSVVVATTHGITVAASIARSVGRLLDAAASAGVFLGGTGYRSDARQIEIRRQHCGPTNYDIYDKPSLLCHPPVARPGSSMHEQGLAIDFTYNGGLIRSHSDAGYQWLAKNAAAYGLYNLPQEPWHWSVNGR